MQTMNTTAGETVDSVGASMFLLHPTPHQHPPIPPVSKVVDGGRQFLQLFQHVDHLAVPGRPSCGEIDEVDRLQQHHQAPALTCDEENSSSSNDSIIASESRISDVTTASRDTAVGKLSRLQRPEHRQVYGQFL